MLLKTSNGYCSRTSLILCFPVNNTKKIDANDMLAKIKRRVGALFSEPIKIYYNEKKNETAQQTNSLKLELEFCFDEDDDNNNNYRTLNELINLVCDTVA